ncbi:MAG: septum formation protein Maf [Desulfovibrio sp.]|nr:MAG: septum formation protein Maf [Desulfovibrio sp.]
MFMATLPVILASGSPRRRDMLAELGMDFRVVPSQAPEPERQPEDTPEKYAVETAWAKGVDVAGSEELAGIDHAVLLAADTIVVLDDDVLGKPSDKEEAVNMLKQLAGRSHEVITGVLLAKCLRGEVREEKRFAVSTKVTMFPWAEDAIRAYAATGEPLDKAGGYGIQGKGGFLVSGVRGSYHNVVGLPLVRVLEVLVEWGAVVPRDG